MNISSFAVKDPCNKLSPCQNGATCSNILSPDASEVDYVCNCTDGYEGRLCEVDVDQCSPNPCQNGGTCQVIIILLLQLLDNNYFNSLPENMHG